MNNFKYALSLTQLLYDINIVDEDDAIEIGLLAFNKIGNKRTKLFNVKLPVINGEVNLPCNCDIIEAVTYCAEDWNNTDNISNNGDVNSLYIEHYVESRKNFKDPLYLRGKFVEYRRVGDKLFINHNFGFINLLYHGLILDEEGLPEINDKEATAIADYIAYTYKYKEAIRTSNATLMQIAKDIKLLWLFHVETARSPEYISQNDMNKILDAQASWGRKLYGKSFKPTM